MKYTYRIPCVNYYNIGPFEHWLSDCSAKGLFFGSMTPRDTYRITGRTWHWLGLVRFQRDEPARKKYRLEPLRGGSDWPPVDEWEMYEDMGWEYAGSIRGLFYVFSAPAGAEVPEPHTDPALEAELYQQALEKGQRWLRQLLWAWGIVIALCLLNIAVLVHLYSFVEAFLLQNGLMHVFMMVLIGLALSRTAADIRQLKRLKAQLSAGVPIDHDAPHEKESRTFRLNGAALCVLLALIVAMPVASLVNLRRAAYSEDLPLPFPSPAELAGPDYVPETPVCDGNDVPYNCSAASSWSPLIPERYDVNLNGFVGEEPCRLAASYYRTRFEALAGPFYRNRLEQWLYDEYRLWDGFQLRSTDGPGRPVSGFDEGAILSCADEEILVARRGAEIVVAFWRGPASLEELLPQFSAALDRAKS